MMYFSRPGPDGHTGTEMKKANLLRAFLRLLHDEQGGEVLEYAIVAGLISITAISVIATWGIKVLARWTSVNSSM